MRIDKYLKVSRLIKRRTVAAEACTGGRITINDKVAKASSEVKVGDVVAITFGERVIKVRVENIAEHALKADASGMYSVIEG